MEDNARKQRIEKQLVRVIRVAGSIPDSTPLEDVYFPINISQVRELEEAMHTRLEMLNLSKKAEDAAKVVMNEYLWQWFYEVQDNSVTSAAGCIAPVVMNREAGPTMDAKDEYSNRWGFVSQDEYEKHIAATDTKEQ